MRVVWIVAGVLLVACGSDVSSGGGGGAGGTSVDPDCFEACIDKGVSDAECNEACATTATGKGGETSKTTSTGQGGAAGGAVDVEYEKSCYTCFEDNKGGACAAEYEACLESLACLQLRDCPFTCGEKPGCVEECNEIIPSGVAPLTALVQCMACGDGPCSSACSASLNQAYCE